MRLLVLLLFAMVAFGQKQPIAFSHKQHAGDLKLACKMCHAGPEPGERMTIAGTAVCMQCHSAIKTDSPAIQRLAALDKMARPMPWVKVYGVPSFVNFSHKAGKISGSYHSGFGNSGGGRSALSSSGNFFHATGRLRQFRASLENGNVPW